MSEVKLRMKILVDKSSHKVVFAEGRKECVDFLFHILSLPLGSITGYITKESMPLSIGSLYGSFEKFETNYLQEGLVKDCLLNPKPTVGSARNVPLLTINKAPDNSVPKKFYTCTKTDNHRCINTANTIPMTTIHKYVSDGVGAYCPVCYQLMNQELVYVASPATKKEKELSDGVKGYVKGLVTYMIKDDLSVQPMSMVSCLGLLSKFNVQDVKSLEEREVILDIKKGLALMKALLMSKTVLTDVFLGNKVDAV